MSKSSFRIGSRGGGDLYKLDTANDNDIEKFVNTKLGIRRDGEALDRHIEALTTPKVYAAKRKALMEKLAKHHIPLFKDTIKELVDSGYADDDSRDLAMKRIERVYEGDLAIVEDTYPADYLPVDLQKGRLVHKIGTHVADDEKTQKSATVPK